ncbi:hypothetical protein NDU88_005278 [Pleurodeles waltl]|uniref:Uncharacterized protein n=1 Tax=Pleurodeles waltl TaxID=8319 RepID=A0AAV7LKP4_PLEWA|nr:hypothetical protein NDU88_005278 [Pleurodeles waltl]
MAKNSGQGQRCGTASTQSGRHQEAVERPTGEDSHHIADHVAPQRAPVTSLDQEQPTTSAGDSGQEAPTQRQATRTPPPAEEEPPRKRNLRSHKKTE